MRTARAGHILVIAALVLVSVVALVRAFAAAEAEENAADAAAPLVQEEIAFRDGPTSLAGTLFKPASGAVQPGVVVLAGSDRSARGPERIRIARHLAEMGLAALVYDSPGTGASTGNALLQSREERTREALAAVAHLRSVPGVLPSGVGVFGGSEGADIALAAAARDSDMAFAIAVSGAPGVPLLNVMRYSAEKRSRDMGLTVEETAKAVAFKEVTLVLFTGVELADLTEIEGRAAAWGDEEWSALIEVARRRLEPLDQAGRRRLFDSFKRAVAHFSREPWLTAADPGNSLSRLSRMDADTFSLLLERGQLAQDWDRTLSFDPARIRCPVLAVWGSEDSFLPPDESAARLRRYMADAGHPDYEIVLFPGADHSLTVGGPSSEYAPGYLELLEGWLSQRLEATAGAARG